MGLANAINNRPVRVLGFLTALHSILYGVGYLTNWGGFNGALVGLQVNSVVLSGVLGTILSIVGILLMWSYIKLNPQTIRAVSYVQAATWAFVGFLYLINGAYMLALVVGFTWALVSHYLAFATKNRKDILRYDLTDVAQRDTDNEDTL